MKETHTLQLKDIAPYLLYGLKAVNTHGQAIEIFGINTNSNFIQNIVGEETLLFVQIKPLLRQLSDLTKEIEVNGERFVPCDVIGINTRYVNFETFIRNHNSLTYNEVQMLISWHFDVFGLINKGLAIDLNTITNG